MLWIKKRRWMDCTGSKGAMMLRSVDPGRNRYRYYKLETDPLGLFVGVKRSWGRMGKKKRCVVKLLCPEEAEREVRNLMRVRARHGYEVLGRGRDWSMSTKTEGKVPRDELKKLVMEFELLGSREAREEALEYIRFLREELGKPVSCQEQAWGATGSVG